MKPRPSLVALGIASSFPSAITPAKGPAMSRLMKFADRVLLPIALGAVGGILVAFFL